MSRRIDLLMWIGVLAAPGAWALEHVLGYGVAEATCDPAGRRWGVAFHTWIVVALVVSGLVALAGLAAAVVAFRAVRDAGNDSPPPPGRVWLMAICGIVISPIFLMIIVLSGVGALLLGSCHQG